MNKAYIVRECGGDECRMVFCKDANEAKSYGASLLDCEYIDVRANREPRADKYASIAIGGELDWSNEKHRKILEKEFDWFEV